MAVSDKGSALADRFHRDIVALFETAPSHGEVSFRVHFVDGQPVRFEQGVIIGRLARPDREARR